MKNVFILGLFLVLVIINSQVYAAEDRQPKTVSGKVRNQDLTVAKDAEVAVTCNGITRTDTTSINGNYSVTFANLECEQFDTVTAVVDTGSLSGSTAKQATFALTVSMPEIILQAPNVSSVPEFGIVPGILALAGSIVAYAKIKKQE